MAKQDKFHVVCDKIVAFLRRQSIEARSKFVEEQARWVVDVDGIELRIDEPFCERKASYRVSGRVNNADDRYIESGTIIYAPSTQDEIEKGKDDILRVAKKLLLARNLFANEPRVLDAICRAVTTIKESDAPIKIEPKTSGVSNDKLYVKNNVATNQCSITLSVQVDVDSIDAVVAELVAAHRRITGAT